METFLDRMIGRKADVAASVLVFCAFVVGIAARGPPRLSVDGYRQRHLVNAGETLRLGCPVDTGADSTTIVTWFKDDDEIHVGWERYRVRQDALYVRDVESDDTGVFVCRATNGFGTVDVRYLVFVMSENSTVTPPTDFDEDFLHSINGRPAEAPSFLDSAEEATDEYVVLRPGGAMRLPCHAVGRPKPEVKWYKDDRQLTHDDDDWMLTLNDVTREHGGRYTCRVTNRLGSISRNYVIEIANDSPGGAPVLTPSELSNVTVNVGSPATVSCRAYSEVPARLQWMRATEMPDNRQLQLLPPRLLNSTVTVDGDGRYYEATFRIQSTVTSDSGLYICAASNSRGSARTSVFVHVRKHGELGVRINNKNDDDSVGVSGSTSTRNMQVIIPLTTGCAILLIIVLIVVVCRRPCCSKSSSFTGRSNHNHHHQAAQQQHPPAAGYATVNTYLTTRPPNLEDCKQEYTRCYAASSQQQVPVGVGGGGYSCLAAAGVVHDVGGAPLQTAMYVHGSTRGLVAQASPLQLQHQQQQLMQAAPPSQQQMIHYHYYNEC